MLRTLRRQRYTSSGRTTPYSDVSGSGDEWGQMSVGRTVTSGSGDGRGRMSVRYDWYTPVVTCWYLLESLLSVGRFGSDLKVGFSG